MSSSSPSSSSSIPSPCPHLHLFRSSSPDPFRSLHLLLRPKPPALGSAELLLDLPPRCSICPPSSSSHSSPRLYFCLSCSALSCPLHAPDHLSHSSSPPHALALDIHRAELFCFACRDQVYDPDFDFAVLLASHHHRRTPSLSSTSPPPKRRRLAELRPWTPTPREQRLIDLGSSPLWYSDAAAASARDVPWGLRGLNNLGSTCFMNSVLQALLHTPPLRNYFLGDRHNPYLCRRWRHKADAGEESDEGKVVCLVCDLDAIYSAVFSGSRTPYSPAKFLYSWWQHASNLAGYEQQDAHEFFISMLDGIHEKLGRERKKPHTQGSGDCCIAHRVFSGILRSDVTCTVCGFTSTTYDPCIDISLNLDSSQHPSKMSQKSKCSNGGKESASYYNSLSTLAGCLKHFTRSERLGSDQKLFCQQCQVRQESLKQMSIRKVPLVTCFHIKRFEHSTSRKISRKVDRYLQFPFSLDMGPYLSSSILRSRFGNRMFAFDAGDEDSVAKKASNFELFAVITHSGRLESGHYTTFLRLSSRWYKCDDAWITQVGEASVRAAQAYMLFYVQKVLFYKASENA